VNSVPTNTRTVGAIGVALCCTWLYNMMSHDVDAMRHVVRHVGDTLG
jgi:hypothetical protein